jgi:Mrp family chromosome partitioning ATPase
MTEGDSVEPTVIGTGWKHRKVVGAWILVAVVLCSASLVLRPRRYQGTASILLQPGVAPGFDSSVTPDRFVADQVALLRSPVVADRARAILRQGDSGVPASSGASIGTVSASSNATNSEVTLSVTADTAASADAAVQALLDAYTQVRNENQQQATTSLVKQLDVSIADADAQLSKLSPTGGNASPALAANIGQLQAEVAALQQQRDQVSVNNTLRAGRFIVSSPPRASRHSIWGAATKLGLLAALAGILVGLGHAYLLSQRRRRFASKSEPKDLLRMPLKIAVPQFDLQSAGAQLVVRDAPESAAAEAFAFAAQMQAGRHAEARVIAVTSAENGVGATTVVANLGLALAQCGLQVLMIDGAVGGGKGELETCRPSLTELFHDMTDEILGLEDVVEAGASLSEARVTAANQRLVLLGGGHRRGRTDNAGPLTEVEVATVANGERQTGAGAPPFRPAVPRLVIAGDQPQPAAVAPGLGSLAVEKLLVEARELFDCVLIDSPPVLSIGARGAVLQAADQVVLVVAHGEQMNPVQEASRRIHMLGVTDACYAYNRAPARGRSRSTHLAS